MKNATGTLPKLFHHLNRPLEGALPAKYTFTIKNDFMLIM
jgi:hypothetical protein